MTTILLLRNAPTDSCHNLTRCTKTSFLLTPHYICANINSDNLHNAAFIGCSLVARVMADEHLIVVLRRLIVRGTTQKTSFSQRTVKEWNILAGDCVGVSSVNMFKNN